MAEKWRGNPDWEVHELREMTDGLEYRIRALQERYLPFAVAFGIPHATEDISAAVAALREARRCLRDVVEGGSARCEEDDERYRQEHRTT